MIATGLLAWCITGLLLAIATAVLMDHRRRLDAGMIYWVLGLGLICGPWMAFGLVRECISRDDHD